MVHAMAHQGWSTSAQDDFQIRTDLLEVARHCSEQQLMESNMWGCGRLLWLQCDKLRKSADVDNAEKEFFNKQCVQKFIRGCAETAVRCETMRKLSALATSIRNSRCGNLLAQRGVLDLKKLYSATGQDNAVAPITRTHPPYQLSPRQMSVHTKITTEILFI